MMKKLLLFILVITIWSCSNDKNDLITFNISRKFPAADLNKDFTVLRLALEEAHPGIYRYTNKKYFDALFDSMQSNIKNEMREVEFFRFIAPIIAQIRCGHTSISLSDNYWQHMIKGEKYLPLQLKFISNKAYVLKNYNTVDLIGPGSEIISINQHAISDIVKTIFNMIPSDGNIRTAKYRRLDEEFPELFYQYLSQADSFDIKYLPFGDNVPQKKILSATTWDKILEHKDTYMAHQREPLKFEIISELNMAIMTIVTFIPSIIENRYGAFHQFIDSAFALIEERNVQNLVIDVRRNNGGDIQYFSYVLAKLIDAPFRVVERIDVPTTKYSFLQYTEHGFFFNFLNSLAYVKNEETGRYDLKGKAGWHQLVEPQEPHFNGKIFILTDGWSFSAASDFCAVAHYNADEKITFIGEETGGAYYGNNSGDWIKITLPNTKIQVNIPIRYYLLAVSDYQYSDRGIIPDYKIVSNIEDILNQNDKPLEFSLDLIRQSN